MTGACLCPEENQSAFSEQALKENAIPIQQTGLYYYRFCHQMNDRICSLYHAVNHPGAVLISVLLFFCNFDFPDPAVLNAEDHSARRICTPFSYCAETG